MTMRGVVCLGAALAAGVLAADAARAQPHPPAAASPTGTRLFAIPADGTGEVVELSPVDGGELARWPAPVAAQAATPPLLAYDGRSLFYLARGDDRVLLRLDPDTGDVQDTLQVETRDVDAMAALDGMLFLHLLGRPGILVYDLRGRLPELVGQIARAGLPKNLELRGLAATRNPPALYTYEPQQDVVFEISLDASLTNGQITNVFPPALPDLVAIAAVDRRLVFVQDGDSVVIIADRHGTPVRRLGLPYPIASLAADVLPHVRLHLVPTSPVNVEPNPQGGFPPVTFRVLAEIVNPGPLLGIAGFAVNVETTGGQLFFRNFSQAVQLPQWDLHRDPGRSGFDPPAEPGPGDLDGDGDVDVFDVLLFERCTTEAAGGACLAADLDGDGVVTSPDFRTLRARYTGARGVETRDLRGVGATQWVFPFNQVGDPQNNVTPGLGLQSPLDLFRGLVQVEREGVVDVVLTGGRVTAFVGFSTRHNAWIVEDLPVMPEGGFAVTAGRPVGGSDFDDPDVFQKDWRKIGDGTAELVPDPDDPDNTFLRLIPIPGGAVGIETLVPFDAVDQVFALRLRYHFLGARGEMRIFVNGVNTSRTHAPPTGRPGAFDSHDSENDPAPLGRDDPDGVLRPRFAVFEQVIATKPFDIDPVNGLVVRILYVSGVDPLPAGVAAADGEGDGIDLDDVSGSEPEDCSFSPPGDFNGDAVTDAGDYQPLNEFYGGQVETNDAGGASCTGFCCLDQLTGDGYIDAGDYAALDLALSLPLFATADDKWGGKTAAATGTAVGQPIGRGHLLVIGKDATFADHIYELDETGACVQVFDGAMPSAYTRLRQGPDRHLYLVNSVGALERFVRDGSELVRQVFAVDSVYTGPQGENVVVFNPRDVAFDADGKLYLYPVEVDGNGLLPELAAARFRIDEQADPPALILEALYADPSRMTNPREIAVDAVGNVYVTNGEADEHGDWIVVFDADGGAPIETLDLQDLITELGFSPQVRAPTGLEVSLRRSVVYIASGLGPTFYRLAIDRSAGVAFVADPAPAAIVVPGMDFISDLAEDHATGALWITGFARVDSSLEPRLAVWSGEVGDPPVPVEIDTTGCTALALPLAGAVWFVPGLGDFDEDGDVDLSDYLFLAGCVSGAGQPHAPGCAAADFDGDGDVDLADAVRFQSLFTGPL